MFTTLKNKVDDALWRRSIRHHHSNMGWRDTPRYDSYLQRCRQAWRGTLPDAGEIAPAVEAFGCDGVTSFRTHETARLVRAIADRMAAREASGEEIWDSGRSELRQHAYTGDLWHDFPEVRELLKGPLATFLTAQFGAWPKYLYGISYRSQRLRDDPGASQLWHTDAGPPICINVLIYLSNVDIEDGPIHVVPWSDCVPLFLRQPAIMRRRLATAGDRLDRMQRREILCQYYEESITAEIPERVRVMTGPMGTVVPFRNNCLHRGGFPDPNHERRVMIFHCYPSHVPTDWDLYDRKGLGKTVPYPKAPAAAF